MRVCVVRPMTITIDFLSLGLGFVLGLAAVAIFMAWVAYVGWYQ